MRLNGALKPQGASIIYDGGSNGAEYHDKDSILLNNNNNNINNSNSISSSNNNKNKNNKIDNNKKSLNNNDDVTIRISNSSSSYAMSIIISNSSRSSSIHHNRSPTRISHRTGDNNDNEKVKSCNNTTNRMIKIENCNVDYSSGNNSNNNDDNNKNSTNYNKNNNNNKSSSKINYFINFTSFMMVRVQKSFSFYHLWFIICSLYVFTLLPHTVYCDDNENGFFVHGFSMEPEMTTPEFDYASRGRKKFGDKCETTLECGFPGSECHPKKKSCQCTEDLPVTNHLDKCGKGASINESCFFNEQCEAVHFQTECRDGRCVCRFEMTPTQTKDGIFECKGKQIKREPERYIDPAMIGVLVGMALMFIIICVVLRLFSNARWRENRTIFNTPNPRLMNVSLLRDSKLLHGQERRGSRMSVRVPSRQPSMASLRPHSPNPSLGSKSASRGSSNASVTSIKSNRSNSGVTTNITNNSARHNSITKNDDKNITSQQQPLIANITSNPVADNVTIEIIDPTNK